MATVIERAQAITVVQDRCAATVPPVLTAAHVADLVDAAARPDRHGTAVHDDGWWPTYDLNAAAAAGWDAKAAKAANRFDITVDGQTLTRSQVVEHCRTQAAQFRARMAGTVPR